MGQALIPREELAGQRKFCTVLFPWKPSHSNFVLLLPVRLCTDFQACMGGKAGLVLGSGKAHSDSSCLSVVGGVDSNWALALKT